MLSGVSFLVNFVKIGLEMSLQLFKDIRIYYKYTVNLLHFVVVVVVVVIIVYQSSDISRSVYHALRTHYQKKGGTAELALQGLNIVQFGGTTTCSTYLFGRSSEL